jgi:uncharacterized protein (DUF885 family)
MLHPSAHRISAAAVLMVAAACSPSSAQRPVAVTPPTGEAARAVTAVADEYHAGFLEAFPLQGFISGDARAPLDRIDDNSLAGLARWQAREDAWLRRLEAVAPAALAGTPEAVTHAILREALSAAVAGRVCRSELWRVTQMFGVQQLPALLATQQPVGTPERRAAALVRFRALAPYIDTEIVNLREGVARGYTVPRANAQAVIEQLDQLLGMRPEDSPVMVLARRDGSPDFRAALVEVVRTQLNPALDRYRAHLRGDYLPRARQSTAVADLPRGVDCYRARVRGFTTLDIDPRTVHQMGLDEGARIQTEMRVIAQRSFATGDLRALFDRFRKDDQFRFKTRDEVLAQARSALDRVHAALPRWFGRLPRAPMVLDPCLPFEEKSGCPNSYYPAAQDGSRPAQWRVNTSPERASRVDLEAIAFHEGYPGHHLQVALAQERTGVHPVSRLLFNSGYTEGWGLYSERVAHEMGAYSTDMAQLGRLSSAAWRAARLVVDPGLHVLGWSREKAIDYLLANTVISREGATSEVDRYIIMPGQATAYMVGRMEIERLRREAEAQLGAAFDIRAFHDRVLGNGSVPLPFLRADIQAWQRVLR